MDHFFIADQVKLFVIDDARNLSDHLPVVISFHIKSVTIILSLKMTVLLL